MESENQVRTSAELLPIIERVKDMVVEIGAFVLFLILSTAWITWRIGKMRWDIAMDFAGHRLELMKSNEALIAILEVQKSLLIQMTKRVDDGIDQNRKDCQDLVKAIQSLGATFRAFEVEQKVADSKRDERMNALMVLLQRLEATTHRVETTMKHSLDQIRQVIDEIRRDAANLIAMRIRDDGIITQLQNSHESLKNMQAKQQSVLEDTLNFVRQINEDYKNGKKYAEIFAAKLQYSEDLFRLTCATDILRSIETEATRRDEKG